MHEGSSRAYDQLGIKFSASLMLAWIGGFIPLESGPIWIPAARMHFGVTGVVIGLVASMQFIMSALTAILVAPRIAGRTLREPVLACMALILFTSLVDAFLNPAFPVFVLLRAADGAAAGLCIACCSMLANRTVRVARSFGMLQLGQIAANALVFGLSAHIEKKYGLSGVYFILSVILMLGTSLVLFSAAWPATLKNLSYRSAASVKAAIPVMKIAIACSGIAMIYCALVALVTNATGFGARAGLTFAQVGIILAISTPAGASGSLIATIMGGRAPPTSVVLTATSGAVVSGFCLAFLGFSFASLVVPICGYFFFLYIGFPTVFAGISRLEPSGRAAAAVQGAQMIGLALGPTIGAMIAQKSIDGLAITVTVLTGLGFVLAGTSIWISGGNGLAQIDAGVGDDEAIKLKPAARFH